MQVSLEPCSILATGLSRKNEQPVTLERRAHVLIVLGGWIALSVCFAVRADRAPPPTAANESDMTVLKQAQSDRLTRIPGLEVMFSANSVPKFLTGATGVIVKTGSQVEMDSLLANLGPAFLARGTESLTVKQSRVVKGANVVSYRSSQMIRGMPVFVTEIVITAQADTGEVLKVSGGFLPDRGLETIPLLSATEAIGAASAILRQMISDEGDELLDTRVAGRPTLGYALVDDGGALAWEIKLCVDTRSREDRLEHLLIDAASGILIDRFPDVMH